MKIGRQNSIIQLIWSVPLSSFPVLPSRVWLRSGVLGSIDIVAVLFVKTRQGPSFIVPTAAGQPSHTLPL